MDCHFSPDLVFPEENMPWYEVVGEESNIVPVVNQSAFRPYTKSPGQGSAEKPWDGGGKAAGRSMRRRMVDLLRRNWEERRKAEGPASERCRRHMMNERVRRDKQRQSYFALHSLLPTGTKNDKNSIVQSALRRMEELQGQKKELERRIESLERSVKRGRDEMEDTKIELKVEEPVSGIDSMLEALKCLQNLGAKPKTIQANFSPQRFSTIIHTQTKITGEEVQEKVEKTLQEAEWKLLFLPQASFSID